MKELIEAIQKLQILVEIAPVEYKDPVETLLTELKNGVRNYAQNNIKYYTFAIMDSVIMIGGLTNLVPEISDNNELGNYLAIVEDIAAKIMPEQFG